jgi:predicted TIM-barrel fold metal-dependent hydrolase
VIIDAHAHLGSCRVFDQNVTEEVLVEKLESNGLDAIIVQPFPGAPDPAAVHDRIAALGRRYPDRVYGLASLSPHGDPEHYRAELTRCVRELGFVGVKLHTIGHAVNPMGKDADMVARLARELGIAVMVHTGAGIPFSLPAMAIPLAQRYPDLPIVLAHGGYGIFTAEAQMAAQLCPNIYLEPSWAPSSGIFNLVNTLGAERVMFGSDVPINQAPELAKYRLLGLSESDLETCLWRTAAQVFKLRVAAAA